MAGGLHEISIKRIIVYWYLISKGMKISSSYMSHVLKDLFQFP